TVRNLGMAFGVSLASILISLWLGGGSVLSSSPLLVSQSTGIVLVGAAALCAIGVVTALLR
ncbi:MAG TPA: MFS transporter, partial [Methanocella sp.]|nr:MFS transporter [Methanocella sp.]